MKFVSNGVRQVSFVICTASICLVLLLTVPSQAQLYTGSITGVVQDPSGAVVPKASVVLTDNDKGQKYTAKTDSSGRYVLRALPPSTYAIRVEAAGFKSEEQRGIMLVVNQNLTLNVPLQLGKTSETVEVTGQAPVLETEDAVTGQNLDRKVINDLPLVGRSVFDLALLTPGVTQPAGNTFGPNTMANNFISDGGRNAQADILIDGVSTVGVEQNTAIVNPLYTPSVDAVQEFKVQQSNFSAEVGFTAGTVVNVVSRSGTNRFHGSLYEFFRNDKLNANNYFNNQAHIPIAPIRWNEFGGTIGGPIRKNRTFFFFDYEGARQSISVTKNAGVPSLAERGGDFGEVCTGPPLSASFDANTGLCSDPTGQIWDPYTGVYDTSQGGPVRSNFIPFNNLATYTSPGNSNIAAVHPIPSGPGNTIDPVASKMMQLFPMPNVNVGTDRFNNWVGTGADRSRNDQFDIKIDHRFNDANTFSAKYSHQSGYYKPANLFGNVGDAYSSGRSNGSANLLALNFVHTFSPTTLLTVSLGLTRAFSFDHGGSAADFPNFDPVKDLGMPSYIEDAGIKAAPSISVYGGYNSEGGNNSIGTQAWTYLKYAQETHHLIGSLSHTTGRHELKFGAEGRLHRVNIFFPGIPAGTYSFDVNSTSQAPWDGSGDAMAGFMIGAGGPSNWGAYEVDYAAATQNWNIGSFVQDNWRATDKLTLNIGMRYDLDLPRTERYDRISWLDLTSPSPLQVPGMGPLKGGLQFASNNERAPFDNNYHGFGPRFGFAYKIRPKTVVRGGYGIYYTQNKGAAAGTGISDQGFVEQTNWLNTYHNDGATPWGFLSDPFPPQPRQPTGSSNGLLTDVGFPLAGPIRTRTARPYEQTWSFGIQDELPGRIVVETNYVGKKGTHLYFGNAGSVDILTQEQAAAYVQNPDFYNAPVPNPFFGIITDPNSGLYGFSSPDCPTQNCVQRWTLTTPYPQFTGISATDPPWASSTYHALQLRAEKQFSNGLQFLATYTNSKSIDDSSVGGGGLTWLGGSLSNVLPNPWDHRAERSLSQFDISQVLQFSYVYELPVGRGKRFGHDMNPVLNAFIGGWQTNGIWRFDTGQPIILTLAGGTSIPTWGPQRPLLLAPLKRAPGLNLNQYFACGQPDCSDVVTAPPAYGFGNTPKVQPNLRAPGTRTGALSLFKEFNLALLREGARLEFRAETFNALNHPQFSPPASTWGNGDFGVISSQANKPREMQLALKLYW
jgi:Carboxypeptidase regulatory-like domain/TonB dependent receptor